VFGRQKETVSEKIENVIGPTTRVNGHIKSDGGVRIDGAFEGVIETAGNVVIGQGAKVMAQITAHNVSVSGAVKGNIAATGRLEILAKGQVWGDISVAALVVEEGGFFRGTSAMPGEADPVLVEPAKEAGGEMRDER